MSETGKENSGAMNPVRYGILIGTGLVLAGTACSNSTGGGDGGTPPGNLTFLQLASGAPQLCNSSDSAWVIKDSNATEQQLALRFPESGSDCSGSTQDFLRLTIKGSSLLRHPDGTLIADGDSVHVVVTWVGSDSILFDLQPTGLQFDPFADPAKLKIEYGECGPDLNHDNTVDAKDDDIERQLDIWRQERSGDDFVRVGTAHSEDDNEIEAKLNGFSRYAIAY